MSKPLLTRHMRAAIFVLVHPSQFPGRVSRDRVESLRARRIDPKFHYLTHRQMQAWSALHARYSPFSNTSGGAGIYDAAFAALTSDFPANRAHVISLGCGTGGKDARLLEGLRTGGIQVQYTPVDVGLDMVLAAAQAAGAGLAPGACRPVLLDLAAADDLGSLIGSLEPSAAPRVILFFGMLPNFEPESAAARLRSLARRGDFVLLSANLAPGDDYAAGVRRCLVQYDNEPTRAWVGMALEDLGLDPRAGDLTFGVEPSPGLPGLLRIVGRWTPRGSAVVRVGGTALELPGGEPLQVFFSNRYREALVGRFLESARLESIRGWVDPTGEEAVYACRPAGSENC